MKSVLKDGILYSCIDYNSHMLGPGYYNVPESLLKKSFNARVSGGNTPRSSTSRSKASSANSSPKGGIPASALAKQRNKSFSDENSSYMPHQVITFPRKSSLTAFTGGSLRSTTHSISTYSHQMENNNRQQFVYKTPS